MRKKMTTLNQILMSTLLLTLVACGGEEKKKNSCDDPTNINAIDCQLSQEQKDEAARKAEEQKQIINARRRKMLIEHQNVGIANLTGTTLTLRLNIKLNGRMRPVLYSTMIDSSLPEQFDLQDKTNDIQNMFPHHNLEISSFKFKAGKVDVMGIEYRFLRYTEIANESASQFVLMILNKDLGNKAVVKNEFEFPTKSDLVTWAKKTSQKTIEKPTEKPDDKPVENPKP